MCCHDNERSVVITCQRGDSIRNIANTDHHTDADLVAVKALSDRVQIRCGL